MRLKRIQGNRIHHGMGEHGSPKRIGGLIAGAHMPQKVTTGHDDRKGYQGSNERRNGDIAGGKLGETSDTRRRRGKDGNGMGSPAPGVSSGRPASLARHEGTAGRGDKGRVGKGDGYKGKPTSLSEDISHSAFEKLGSE